MVAFALDLVITHQDNFSRRNSVGWWRKFVTSTGDYLCADCARKLPDGSKIDEIAAVQVPPSQFCDNCRCHK